MKISLRFAKGFAILTILIYICICVYYICTVSRFCFVNLYLYRFWYINLFSTKLLGETRHFPAGVDATKVHAGASC